MKLQVIVTAMALVIGTSAFADMTTTTTTTVVKQHRPMHHHNKMHHKKMHHKKMHHKRHHHGHKVMMKKTVVVHEGISPPGSVTVIK